MERCNGLSLKGSKQRAGNGGGIKHDHVFSWHFKFIVLLHRWGRKEGTKMGLLTNLVKKYGYVKNEACSTQSGPSAHLSAGVQGLDFVLGL